MPNPPQYPPENSWVEYNIAVELREVGARYARHKPMQEQDPDRPRAQAAGPPVTLSGTTAARQAPAAGPGAVAGGRVANLFGAAAGRGGGGGSGDITQSADAYAGAVGGQIPDVRPKVPDSIHEVETPSYVLRLVGRAIRIGHPVPMPVLESVGGRPVPPPTVVKWLEVTGRQVEEGVFGVEFVLEYQLDMPPQGPLPVPANPLLGVNGKA